MGIPLICSVILLKDNNQLLPAVCEQTSDYLFHEHEYDDLDLGKKSIQCGRRVDSLKLWLSFKYYGMKGYEERIDKMVSLAEYLTQKVESNPSFELLAPTTYCNVNFRYKPELDLTLEEINRINLKAREEMYKEGLALFNYCYIDEELSIRFILANPDVEISDLDYILEVFLSKCKNQTS
jgi:glutamate/tyrosine decarboxylase-like PLP-dependent enzyme